MAPKRHIPNAENATRAELETAAKVGPTQKDSNRFRAIIALIMGIEHAQVAELFSISELTLRRWIIRFNRQGIDGLIDEKRSGRPRKIPVEHVENCLDLLEHPEKVEEVHWTGRKFHGYLKDQLDFELSYRTVLRFFREHNYRLKVPRSWSDKQDEQKRKAFRKQLGTLLQDAEIELWFGDESGFEADPRPRRRWAKKGEKIKVTRNQSHIRMNVCGIICPRTGEFYALEFSHSDRDSFQAFLDEANKDLKLKRKKNILILDNASWHKVSDLNWGKLEPLYLPPYSPDLNPIERLWLVIKAEWFTDYFAKTKEQLIERLDRALIWAMNRKIDNQKTCAIRS